MKKLINDGVALAFYNSFGTDGRTLRNQLKKILVGYGLKSTRMEIDKNLGLVKVYYRDQQAKVALKDKLLQSASHKFLEKNQQGKFENPESQAIDLNINIEGSLIEVAENYFLYSNEFIRQYDGLTQLLYEEFFQIEQVKNISQSVEFYNKIKSIIFEGNLSYSYEIESILAEYQDPFRKLGSVGQ